MSNNNFKDKNIYASLDIGSSKVVMLIAQFDDDNNVRIIGYGETKTTNGVKNGNLTDIAATEKDIKEVTQQAQRVSGLVNFDILIVNISGENITCCNNDGVAASLGESVTKDDRDRAIEVARSVKFKDGVGILHTEVQYYILDREKWVADPIDMQGVRRIEAFVHLVLCKETMTKNIKSCIDNSNLDSPILVSSATASVASVCTDDAKNQGVIMIDIGAETCDIAVYRQSSEYGSYLGYTAVMPYGARNATKEMANILCMAESKVEDLKIDYGCVFPSLIGEDEEIIIEHNGKKSINKRQVITDVLHKCYVRIFEQINKDLKSNGILPIGSSTSSVVLTGGGSLIQGAKELAAEVFGMPAYVSKANIDYDLDLNDSVDSAKFATAVGLLIYAKQKKISAKYKTIKKPNIEDNLKEGQGFFDKILKKMF